MSKLPLLPADRYIAELLGLSEEQYRWYMADVERRAREAPQPAVVAEISSATLAIISIVSTLISVGLTIVASFFKPRQPGPPPGLRQTQTQGQTIVDARRFIPRTGFDSVQDIVTLGDPIPLIYTNRELINGQYYGGVRVNVPLIWSQLRAYNKGQLLRAMFLIGEGANDFTIDPDNTAIGNNTLGGYLLGLSENARFSLYFRPNGGRINVNDRIGGTSNDPGRSTNSDVYGLVSSTGITQNFTSDFCHTRRPSTQTQFGIYSLIGNGLGYRVNPQLRPIVNAQITVESQGGGKKGGGSAWGRVVCEPDVVAQGQRQKYTARFSGRSGLISISGDTLTYHLSNTTDAETVFDNGGVSSLTVSIATTENPFSGIANATVASWATSSNIGQSGSTVNATITVNQASVITALGGTSNTNAATDGQYLTRYEVKFINSGREGSVSFQWTVSKSPLIEEVPSFNPFTGTTGTVSTRTGSIYSFTGTTGTVSTSTNDRTEGHTERCGDVAAAVSGRQKTWDDALQIGELYKIGKALAICTGRNPGDKAFNSDADFEPVGGGNAVEATFKLIKSGDTAAVALSDIQKAPSANPPCFTATNWPHLYRVAIANVATLRECKQVRLSFRSTLGIRINGLCNFKDSLTHAEIDSKACLSRQGNRIDPGDFITVDIFASGQMSSSEERYSFFRIRYREAGLNGAYTQLSSCYGVRGITQQPIFNDILFVMPSTKRWEFQIEPISGWEVRAAGSSGGNLELIDSSLNTQRVVIENGLTMNFNGAIGSTGNAFIPASLRASVGPTRFRLASTERGASAEIGLGYIDGTSYVDSWGKLAESFIYEEVRSSAENGPEHEIVAIDEIVPNAVAPQYNNLAILGFNALSGTEWQQFGQMSVYATKGLAGGTHLFPWVLQDLLTESRYGKGDQITNELIDTNGFAAAATWCQNRQLFFDGAVTGRINVRQWAADTAAAHLLFFGESGSQFWLKPAWPGTVASPSAIQVRAIFTAGNILEKTFSMEFFEPEDRRPIQVSAKYREERSNTNLANPGLFPVEREVLVRESSAADTDPIEQLDLSAFCTSRQHAIDAAKFVCRMRRIPDHAIRFTTTHDGILSGLAPADYIRVVVDLTQYNQLRNGGVLANGSLVTTQPFADGNYTVLAWDGSKGNPPAQTTLSVSNNGRTASPAGIIFTLVNTETLARTYQVERISPTEDGTFTIEAVHMPVNSSNILLLADGFTNDANWVIQD